MIAVLIAFWYPLIASSSIPSYYAQPLNASTQATTITCTFSGTEFEISPDKDHGFYTGDAVYYIPEKKEDAAKLGLPGRTHIVGRRMDKPSQKPFLIKSLSINSQQAFCAP